jgi:integrase/recombinase XerD
MTRLRAALADYLTIRRAFGHELVKIEWLLRRFLDHLEERGAETITTEEALAWAMLPEGAPSWHAVRLSAVRGFASYLQTIDPTCEVPPRLLTARPRRAVPYIYSEAEIAALLEATDALRTPHRRATYRTLVGLLAVSGMRIGESMALDDPDVDLDAGTLLVRDTKFGKTRELPLHPTTTEALGRYRRHDDRPSPSGEGEPFFVSMKGRRIDYVSALMTFRKLLDLTGIRPRSEECKPRFHDLRHTFAVRTLTDAHREGAEVEGRLAVLSTYLGHSEPAHTYWYLSATPELMQSAACRLARHLGDER